MVQYVMLAVVGVVVVAVLGLVLRGWYRNAPLRREMRTKAITFRTELSWVKFPDSPWWPPGSAEDGISRMELIIRGDMFRVGAPFGLVPSLEYYFRAPETTIELNRNPLRIYGMKTRREWILVRGRQAGREIQAVDDEEVFP